jgi:hypothetical protein
MGAMTEIQATTPDPPACERCGTRTYPSRREMKMHQLRAGDVPMNRTVDVWRCPSCGREMPRT